MCEHVSQAKSKPINRTKLTNYSKFTLSLATISIGLMKKRLIIFFLSYIYIIGTQAQVRSTFHFLQLPVSSHAAALGGENISIIEDDLSMAWHNPALLSCVADRSLSLHYMAYMDGVGTGSAAYSQVINDRSAWAVGIQFLGYGKMKQTDADGQILGDFSAKDMAFIGMYNYDLSDYWSGGVTAKMLYSHYHIYSSFGIGVDLGLNYYNESSDFSASFAVKNLGAQIKKFDNQRNRLPLDLQFGITKRLAHAPLRLSVTLPLLNDWKASLTDEGKKQKFATVLLNHFIFGLDFCPSDVFYVSLGYNCRRANEMKINGSSHWAGLSAGAGVQVKRVKIAASFAKYHAVGSSLLFNFAMSL